MVPFICSSPHKVYIHIHIIIIALCIYPCTFHHVCVLMHTHACTHTNTAQKKWLQKNIQVSKSNTEKLGNSRIQIACEIFYYPLCVFIMIHCLIIWSHYFFHRSPALFTAQNEWRSLNEPLFNILFYLHSSLWGPMHYLLYNSQTLFWIQNC